MEGLTLEINHHDMSEEHSTSKETAAKDDKSPADIETLSKFEPTEILQSFSDDKALNEYHISTNTENHDQNNNDEQKDQKECIEFNNNESGVIRQRISTLQQFNLKSQLKIFSIKLNSNNTVYSKIKSIVTIATTSLISNDSESSGITTSAGSEISEAIPFKTRTIIFLFAGVLLSWTIDRTLNDLLLNSLIFQIFVAMYILFATLVAFVCINVYLLKQIATRSFVFWYKAIHTTIAMITRMIYFNFWLDWPYNDIRGENYPGWIYLFGIIQIFAWGFAVFCAICSDGVSRLHLKPKIVNFQIIVAIFMSVYFYWQLYFNVYNDNIYKSMTISIGNNNNNVYSFYWRSIALSSFSKIIVFICAQAYNKIKNSKTINVMPIPVKLHPISYSEAKKQAITNEAINNTLQTSGKTKVFEMMQDDIITTNDVKSDSNFNENINININHIPHVHGAKSSSVSTTTEFSSIDELKSSIQVTIIVEQTLFYSLLLLLAKCRYIREKTAPDDHISDATKLKLIEYSGFLLKHIKIVTWGLGINTVLLYFFDSNIIVNLIEMILLTLLLLNVNRKFFYFKRKSVVLYWKLYNTLTLWIVIFWLDYLTKSNKFDAKTYGLNDYSIQLASTIATISTISWVIATLIASLGNGFIQVNNKWRLFGLFCIIGWNLRRAIYHFLNSKLDYQVAFLNQQFSLRSLIVVKCFDLSLWFGVQFYQMLKYPNQMFVRSKIRLEWN